jgi:hypothetical protein
MPEVGFKPTVSESKQSMPMPQNVRPLVPAENHMKPINTKCRITDCYRWWYIHLPLGFKGLIIYNEEYLLLRTLIIHSVNQVKCCQAEFGTL